MDLGLLLLRLVIGGLLVGHGAQKLFGAFGGHGLEGTGGCFASIGFPQRLVQNFLPLLTGSHSSRNNKALSDRPPHAFRL